MHDESYMTNHIVYFKGALSGLRKFLANESPLKLMENAFHFILKALFVLKILKLLSWIFGHVQGGPQKCCYFSLAITFTKTRKPSRFFFHRYWKIVRRVEILGKWYPSVIGLPRNESVKSEVMPEVFKCSVREMRWRQSTGKRGHHQKRNQMDSTRNAQPSCGQFKSSSCWCAIIQQRGAWNEHSINYWKSIIKHYWF